MIKDLLRIGAITISSAVVATVVIAVAGWGITWINNISVKADNVRIQQQGMENKLDGAINTFNAGIKGLQDGQDRQEKLLEILIARQAKISAPN